MQIQDLFSSFEQSAFRLEGLPEYRVDDEAEAFDFFKQNKIAPPGFNSDWGDLVRSNIELGKSMSRLRLFSEPPSEYENFEVRGYEAGLIAGESIRVSPRSAWDFNFDFWAFDGRWIARMNYGPEGEWIGAEVSEMTEADRALLDYWLIAYESATPIRELYP